MNRRDRCGPRFAYCRLQHFGCQPEGGGNKSDHLYCQSTVKQDLILCQTQKFLPHTKHYMFRPSKVIIGLF